MFSPAAYFKKFDWLLFGASILLTALGLAVLYSTSLGSGDSFSPAANLTAFRKQIVFAIAGLLLVMVVPAFNYRQLAGAAKFLYILSAALLVAVLLFGVTIRGTKGWFGIAGLGVQPVEIVKFFIVVFLAKFFSDYGRDRASGRPILVSGAALIIISLLILLEPDLGSAFLLLAVWAALLLAVGVRRKHIFATLALSVAAAAVSWFFLLQPYQKDRIAVFLNPERDPLGKGYNVTQALIAIGSGGVFGKGLGYGSQSHLRFLPERQTDFIFSALAEELGFAGVIVVLLLFGVIFYRGYALAKSSRDDFTLFLVLGVMISLAAETFVNIGGNLRLLPVTGITLPFLSYGGSSLITKFLMVGILQSIAVRR